MIHDDCNFNAESIGKAGITVVVWVFAYAFGIVGVALMFLGFLDGLTILWICSAISFLLCGVLLRFFTMPSSLDVFNNFIVAVSFVGAMITLCLFFEPRSTFLQWILS